MANISSDPNLFSRLDVVTRKILSVLAKIDKTADLSEFSVEVRSEIDRIQSVARQEFADFKIQDHAALSEAVYH